MLEVKIKDPKIEERLAIAAKKRGKSRSAYIKDLLVEHLEELKDCGECERHVKKEIPFVEGKGHFDVEVVGTHLYEKALVAITGGRKSGGVNMSVVATVSPEVSKRYNEDAVSVKIKGKKVGHLSDDGENTEFRQWVYENTGDEQTIKCNARISGGQGSALNADGPFYINLDIPLFDEL